MQRQKLLLPPLHEPINSSRISNFQDYAQWERQRKQAYRDELRAEMLEHTLSKENLLRQKEQDRVEINAIVHHQRQRNEQDRHLKIKTEQKYMHDNWSLLQHSQRPSPRLLPNPEESSSNEHPFIKLIDQQDSRQLQTKNNFIYQNKLNDLQSEMKRAQTIRRKQFESQQRRIFDEHVEDEYRKKRKERELFENKYLKIDKSNNWDCKKEYLQYLKAQANLKRSHNKHQQNANKDYIQEINRASPGNIGLSPASFDRIKQLQTIEKSLKMFIPPSQSRNKSTLDYSNRKAIDEERPKIAYEKVMTERAAPVYENPPSLQSHQNTPRPARVYPIQSQLSQRLEKPPRSPRPYKQFNIINCSDRIFIQ